jgi:hypothetical protein
MTRRVARLVDVGLVRRANARGVMGAITKAGEARLMETTPVYERGIADLFVGKLDDQELAVLQSALEKVILDCSFALRRPRTERILLSLRTSPGSSAQVAIDDHWTAQRFERR